MKRFLALLCTLAVVLSLVLVTAFAAEQDLQAIIDAGTEEIIVLEADASNITVSRDITIDLNGHTIDGVVVQAGTLYCMDSATADYTVADGVYGKVTNATGAVKPAEGYLQIEEGETVSFHAVDLNIHTMTLRAESVGVYYKSNFAADEMVADRVESFGVALSVYAAPGGSKLNRYDGHSEFTDFKAGKDANATGTSTLLKGIMKDVNSDEKNATNAATSVYGRAYIKTAEGYFFGNTVKRSLQEQVEAVDATWTDLSEEQMDTVVAMYKKYTTVMDQWNIPNIDLKANSVEKFQKAETAKDTYKINTTVTLGELFTLVEGCEVDAENLQVTVTNGSYEANAADWTQGTVTLSGVGAVEITITDGKYCVPATVSMNVEDYKIEAKFAGLADGEVYLPGTTKTVGELFEAVAGVEVAIVPDAVQVTVAGETAGADYVANAEDWTLGTLTFTGEGNVTITITDNCYCIPTAISVTVKDKDPVEKFSIVLPNVKDYLYRVGNDGNVSLSSLFKANADAQIGAVEVTVEAMNNAEASAVYTSNATWTNGTLDFNGTGVVKVTITDNDYCVPAVLYLEVINAKNITKATSATANNVVLLNDISGTFVVSNGYTFYGNGFTVTLPSTSVQNVGNGFTGYISVGAAQDDDSANGGNLDNVRIVGPVYPEMYIYRDQAKITNSSDPDYGDGYNMRYFKNSVIVYGGNVTISNCYISGSRTALCLRAGNNVVIENTTLAGGSYANMQICAGSKVTLRDVTTVQVDTADTYGKGKNMHGLGIAVDSSVVDLYIEGELNQHNWLNETIWDAQVPSGYQSSFPDFFGNSKYSEYWHYLNGGTDPYVNLAFIFACNWDIAKIHDNRANVYYKTCDSTIAGVKGGIYAKVNTLGGNAITDADLADPGYTSPGFNPVAPKFNFDNTPNADADDANDANDTYCVYNESTGTLKIGVSGAEKTLDLSKITVEKDGIALAYTAYLNGTQISGSSVAIKAADGAKQTLTFKATSNNKGYDKDGNPIAGSIDYTWNVTVEIATLSFPAPEWNMGGNYQFDKTNLYYVYYSTSQGYGEAVPIYEGIKINYYNKAGTLVNLDLSGTKTIPTGSNNSNSNAFTYTLSDGSFLTMKFSSGWKSGATTHQFTTYNNKVYIYPQSLDNDNYVRAKTTNQDFDVKIAYTFTDPNGQSITQTMRWYNAMASNSSVSTVQWKTFDSVNGKKASVCVAPDTLVTMADGTQKEIRDVSVGELVVAWNFHTGAYEIVPLSLAQIDGSGKLAVLYLYFEDGTQLKVLGEHGIFDANLNTFIFIDEGDVEEYLGHSFVKQDGDGYKTVKLVDYAVVAEETEAYTVLSVSHYNVLLEGLLTVTPAHVGENFFNPFEIGEGLKYDAASVQADIEKYGLYTYEEFADVLTYEQFVALNIPQFKVSVGKGLVTYEGLIYLIKNFINR